METKELFKKQRDGKIFIDFDLIEDAVVWASVMSPRLTVKEIKSVNVTFSKWHRGNQMDCEIQIPFTLDRDYEFKITTRNIYRSNEDEYYADIWCELYIDNQPGYGDEVEWTTNANGKEWSDLKYEIEANGI